MDTDKKNTIPDKDNITPEEEPQLSSPTNRPDSKRHSAGARRSESADSSAKENLASFEGEITEKVVHINRCAKVVKGGRRFSFSALVVTGNHKGQVGIGFGKAREVSEAIRKGTESARKRMVSVVLRGTTLPHEVVGYHSGAKVLLRPASAGTGIIAGASVRAVVEAAGVRDVLAKSLGSDNPANVVRATLCALQQLKSLEQIKQARSRKDTEKQETNP
jgi:small subunit ribosomal protein S5